MSILLHRNSILTKISYSLDYEEYSEQTELDNQGQHQFKHNFLKIQRGEKSQTTVQK